MIHPRVAVTTNDPVPEPGYDQSHILPSTKVLTIRGRATARGDFLNQSHNTDKGLNYSTALHMWTFRASLDKKLLRAKVEFEYSDRNAAYAAVHEAVSLAPVNFHSVCTGVINAALLCT